jgi:hypothetical protein
MDVVIFLCPFAEDNPLVMNPMEIFFTSGCFAAMSATVAATGITVECFAVNFPPARQLFFFDTVTLLLLELCIVRKYYTTLIYINQIGSSVVLYPVQLKSRIEKSSSPTRPF